MFRSACFSALTVMCCLPVAACAQTDAQSTEFLTVALKAFGAGSVQDVTITASAHRIAGSTDVTVPAKLEALASGSTQLTYQTSPGPLVETHIIDASNTASGNWTDPQGAVHTTAFHNLLTEPDWFFPILTVVRGLGSTSSKNLTISYVGAETFRGTPVQHLRLSNTVGSTSKIPGLGQSDLYLNAVTLLPVGLTYNDHPDNNVLVDIPVTILYSSYEIQSGILLPTHVQQLWNNTLSLDLQVQSVALNTGVTITLPAVQ